jgi:MoaA/NifB/PqqE/SkfB family radical SAM enzyme
MEVDKNQLLNSSEVFCMFPWIHTYIEPSGKVLPCCSTDSTIPFGSVKTDSIKNIINNDHYKQMRLNMLTGVKNKSCKFCYKTQDTSDWSFRDYANISFKHKFDEVMAKTNEDGSIDDFKMFYYDVRFSNICNFKCRTCGPGFSSLWAAEQKKLKANIPIVMHADDQSGKLLNEVFEHIDNFEMAYFAGGEPLITEEHYIILEELIKRKKTNIPLRYNTNLSNLKFKDHDLIQLWKQFSKVEISASIDHYGERAEYIRNGTDWGTVESNLKRIRSFDFIEYQINTVMSVFNYVTLADFYSYMIDKDLFRSTDKITLFKCMNPPWASAMALPPALKNQGSASINNLVTRLENDNFFSVQLIKNATRFAESENTWDTLKHKMRFEIAHKDNLRGENFKKTFPELQLILDTE